MGKLMKQMYVGPSIPEGKMGLFNGTWTYTTITRTQHYFLNEHFALVFIYDKRQ